MQACTRPNLGGMMYRVWMQRFYAARPPANYFEIGTSHGHTLALPPCASVAVDPIFRAQTPEVAAHILNKPSMAYFRMKSDAFFARHDPVHLFGRPIDVAFLDGAHQCEVMLRDFIGTERACTPHSVVMLHDCLPVEAGIATRDHEEATSADALRQGWWTGDVWRTALLLRRVRPDLRMVTLDSATSGLTLVTGLDPANRVLADGYDGFVAEMLGWTLEDIGLDRLFEALDVQPTGEWVNPAKLTAAFPPAGDPVTARAAA